MQDFSPGDVIVFTRRSTGARQTWTVLDPPRTSRGKARLRSERGATVTAWWRPGSYGSTAYGDWHLERS